jgi:hypothetical protein
MNPNDEVRLICPHCTARYVIRPEPEEAVVQCPNPSCAKPIELSSQREEPDDFSRGMSRELWPYLAIGFLAVLFAALKGCSDWLWPN